MSGENRLADPISSSKSYTNYPFQLSPGQKRLKTTLNLLDSPLILRSLQNRCRASEPFDVCRHLFYCRGFERSQDLFGVYTQWARNKISWFSSR